MHAFGILHIYVCLSFTLNLDHFFPFIISGTSFVICASPFVFIFLDFLCELSVLHQMVLFDFEILFIAPSLSKKVVEI
jgi:hypothetical protein